MYTWLFKKKKKKERFVLLHWSCVFGMGDWKVKEWRVLIIMKLLYKGGRMKMKRKYLWFFSQCNIRYILTHFILNWDVNKKGEFRWKNPSIIFLFLFSFSLKPNNKRSHFSLYFLSFLFIQSKHFIHVIVEKSTNSVVCICFYFLTHDWLE